MTSTLAWLYLMFWAVFGVALLTLLVTLVSFLLKYREIKRLKRVPAVLLELTPPAHTRKSPLATQQLFSVLHELAATRTWSERFWHRRTVFSVEMYSTRTDGIRFVIQVPENERANFERQITSYLPDLLVRQIKDYVPYDLDDPQLRVVEFRQTGNVVYPLQKQVVLNQHDPVQYLAGAMTQLDSDEVIGLQIVLTPVDGFKVESIIRSVRSHHDLLPHLNRFNFSILRVLPLVLEHLLIRPILFIVDLVFFERATSPTHPPNATRLTDGEREVIKDVYQKINQPMYHANIRLLVRLTSSEQLEPRLHDLRTVLTSYGATHYQSLQPRINFPSAVAAYRRMAYLYRLPSLFTMNACVLAASEIADLYHFPYGEGTLPENLVTSHSRRLPAPLSLKSDHAADLVLGVNNYHNQQTLVSLTAEERERHAYILGGTGNGKTTMMLYGIVQDIRSGKGVAVLDPHGDLAETILRYVPKERQQDVIYFNPDDLAYPIGLNLLELPPGLSGDELLREKDLVTESTISVFRKIFSDEDSGGHRIEYILRNTIQTALTIEGATLFTVFQLLNDPAYRRATVRQLESKPLRDFWRNELGKAGEFQRVKMTAGITSKIGRFLFSASAKRILEQPTSTINFDEVLSGKKILICNFSKGLLGEDTSTLFGTTVLAKIQVASLRRARQEQTARTPYYVYVDEFQNFATMPFIQMLSEARKYKLFLMMAEQSTSQQKDERMVHIILANVGTVICFRSGNPADERLLLPLFRPYLETTEIASLPPYHFYMRSASVHSQEPLSGETIVMTEAGSATVAQETIEASRRHYTKPYVEPQEPDGNAVMTPKPTLDAIPVLGATD